MQRRLSIFMPTPNATILYIPALYPNGHSIRLVVIVSSEGRICLNISVGSNLLMCCGQHPSVSRVLQTGAGLPCLEARHLEFVVQLCYCHTLDIEDPAVSLDGHGRSVFILPDIITLHPPPVTPLE